MKLAARFGNSLHAPGNSQISLISAYTSGADAMDIMLQFTKDKQIVACAADSVEAITGEQGKISELNFADLLKMDFSENFTLRNSPDFSFYKKEVKGRRLPVATLPQLIRVLPTDVIFLLQLEGASQQFIDAVNETISQYNIANRCLVYSDNTGILSAFSKDIKTGWYTKNVTKEQLDAYNGAAIIVPFEELSRDGFEEMASTHRIEIGFIAQLSADKPAPSAEEWKKLQSKKWLWALSTGSILDVQDLHRKSITLIDESFKGKKVDTTRFAFGYAKPNAYGNVYQDDGVHINIKPYDGSFDVPPGDLERRLAKIENKLTFTARDWPYYSGGGVGVLEGLNKDFVAEVDYTVETVAQATTLEMAVVNANPSAHRAEPPTSVRHKSSFFDPHGAPPFAGVEHDEDDGYRINYNLGTEYDNNQYGKPVGNGWDSHGGRLRLERRGAYFSAYYKNETDAHDWVCVGAARNDSLNATVYLRCVAKRWRQEKESNPDEFMPVIPNHFVFKNLKIKLYA